MPDALTVEANTTNHITAFDVRDTASSARIHSHVRRAIKHVSWRRLLQRKAYFQNSLCKYLFFYDLFTAFIKVTMILKLCFREPLCCRKY
jgi:hypothetical protein